MHPDMVARVRLPREAKRGEVVEIRIAIQHPMETGFRYDNAGRPIPKNVINSLTCRYNGTEVFRAEMGSGVAANPYLQFYTVAEASGEISFEWIDDAGQRGAEHASITVTG
jgi:sulfur-oxidizing protein SoxZ